MTADLVSALGSGNKVHLWLRQLALDVGPSAEELSSLGEDERERAAGFQQPRDRCHYVRRHVHLREVLARYLDTSPKDVPLAAPLHQPPRLSRNGGASDLRISLSSSADRSIVALAWRRPVGVDVEWIDPKIDAEALALGLFSPSERQALKAQPTSERRASFFRIWARKEAFVKALGVGFGRDLTTFDVMAPGMTDGGAAVVDREADGSDRHWFVRDITGPSGFVVACCAGGDDWTPVFPRSGA